jgi:enoyl-CoA hydratase/carnithine racemase
MCHNEPFKESSPIINHQTTMMKASSSYRRTLLLVRAVITKRQPSNTTSGRHFASSTITNQRAAPLVSWSLDESTKVGTITLESPSTYNALTVEMGHEFSSAMRQLQHELVFNKKDINAMVLTGAGDNAFSAGGDFPWLRSLSNNSIQANADHMMSFYQSFLCMRQCIPVPVIGALQGPAVGAGAGLALACDMRVASRDTKRLLGLTFSKLGIHAGMGVSHLLPQCVGNRAGVVNELLLTGKFVSAEEAYELGIVNRLVDIPADAEADRDINAAVNAAAVKEEAYSLALEVASQHPVAVRTLVQTLRGRQDEGLPAALLREAYAQATCYARNDWGAGLDAVIERRDPTFDSYHAK